MQLQTSNQTTTSLVAAYRQPPIRNALLLDPTCTSDERRAIDFYQTMTVNKMLTQMEDSQFWRADVVSLAKSCPVIRHLIVAIGATHEVLLAEDASRLNVLALTQCNKAVEELRLASHTDPSVLLASCVLIAAYNILRCDLMNADRSVEAGLQIMSQHSAQPDSTNASPRWYGGDLSRLLAPLSFRGGYKIWASDLAFHFEKMSLADKTLVIETDCVHGPFADFEQAAKSFKTLATETVAKIMRNLAVGAYVDPSCPLARAITRQLELFDTYWNMYYNTIDAEDVLEELEMQSLRVAYYDLYLLYNTRAICPNELAANRSVELYSYRQKILELGEEIIIARHAGFTVTYMERFVNRSLWAVGLYSFADGVRRRVAQLLCGQKHLPGGLNEWLRGTIITIFADLDLLIKLTHPDKNLVERRATPAGYYCRAEDQSIVLVYMQQHDNGGVERKEYAHRWEPEINALFSAAEISRGLQVIMASYRMFGKPVLPNSARGYVRPMHFQGELVPVYPEPDLSSDTT